MYKYIGDKMNKRKILCVIIILMVIGAVLNYFGIFQLRKYTSSEFGIIDAKGEVDFNNNGIDDYTDFLNGAKMDAKNKPKYKSEYYAGGYPPDNIGVCSDVIWRAFKHAGYSLKDMIDKDIVNNLDEVIAEFDKIIGLNRLKTIHLNDSKNTIGAHKDRHECIGIGSLGIDTIKSIINHEKLRNLPFYLETPQKDLNGYAEEISLLKGLYEK